LTRLRVAGRSETSSRLRRPEIPLHGVSMAAEALRRGGGELVAKVRIAGRWGVEADREDRQAFPPDRQLGVALVLAELEEILLVDRFSELPDQVGRVLRAGVEGEETVQIGEDSRLKRAGLLAVEGGE